jgi:hypothetical protein
VEQERRRTEGEWRRIEDDLARMEEERLRERSASVISTTFFIFYFICFLHEISELSRLLACANFAQKGWVNYFCCFLILFAEAKDRFCPCLCETF